MSERIEDATMADIPALGELLAMLFAQESEFEPDAGAQAAGLERIMAEPSSGRVLLAREGEQVSGMVNLRYLVSTALGTPVALLEDMIVAPAARGRGLGTRLLQAAIAAARADGCQRITLLTDHDNAAAQRFYARQGFSASAMQPMRLMLAPPGGD